MDANKVIITGADGFLGRRVVASLQARGASIVAVTRENSLAYRVPGLIRCRTDMADLSRHIPGAAAIIHLATVYGRDSGNIDAMTSANIVLPARLAALAAEYRVPLLLGDTFFAKPGINYEYLAAYTASKRACAELAAGIAGNVVPVVRLIIEHLIGTGDSPEKAIPALIRRMVAQEERIPLTEGTQQRDFVPVETAGELIVSAVEYAKISGKGMRAIGIGTGETRSLRSLLEEIAIYIGYNGCLDFGALPTRNGEPQVSCADTSWNHDDRTQMHKVDGSIAEMTNEAMGSV